MRQLKKLIPTVSAILHAFIWGIKFYADVDECQPARENDCDVNASCENTMGSYTCQCLPGFSGNGINCSDIDECDSQMNDCHAVSVCENTVGSYTCTCRHGYTGNGLACTGGCTQHVD